MRFRAKGVLLGIAVLVPVALVTGRSIYSGQSLLADPEGAFLNWLYMAAPQLVAVFAAAVFVRARRQFLPWALIASALLVTAFQSWIFLFVPPREGALAWIFYIPLWIGLLAVVGGVLAWRHRRTNEL